jgi:spore germination protein
MKKRLHLAMLSVVLLSGCATQFEQATLEDLALVTVMGIDAAEENKIKITVSIPQPSEEAKEKTQTLSTEAELIHQAILKLSTRSEREVSVSQMRAVLIGEELARKEQLGDLIKHLYRDPGVGDNVFLAIVKGTAEDIMKADYPSQPHFGHYINNLLHPRITMAFSPFQTIHDFMYDWTNEVSDPLMPYLVKKEDPIEIEAIALFKGPKMIGTMTPEEAKIVQGLQNVSQIPSFFTKINDETEMDKNAMVLVDFVKTQFKTKSNGDLDHPVILIDLFLRGSIVEYTGTRDFEKTGDIDLLQKAIENQIEKDTREIVNRLIQMEIDPMGLSKSLRRKHRGEWSKETGIEALKRAKIQYQVKVELTSSGTMK